MSINSNYHAIVNKAFGYITSEAVIVLRTFYHKRMKKYGEIAASFRGSKNGN